MNAASPETLELNRLILEEITTKWSLLVLGCLCSGPLRFNALRRENDGITQKALTQCLRRLEASGFITRRVVSTAPVAVLYEIAPLGRSLEPHLRAILKWADDHREEIRSHQTAYAEGQQIDSQGQTDCQRKPSPAFSTSPYSGPRDV